MAETENKVYILICLEGVSDKISGLIDAGYFGEAKNLDYNIWSLKDKMKSLISTRGGEYLLGTYERHVLYLPLSIAENLPLILEGYKNVFGDRMYVGIGLTLPEAKKATDLSMITGKIEMYDPEEEAYQDLGKNQSEYIDGIDVEREIFETSPQPNVYDRQHPEPPKPDATKFKIGKYVPGPDAQTALQLESQMIQATVQVLNAPAQQAQQQMQQQMDQQAQQMQQQQEDQKEPADLQEALSGEKSGKKGDSEKESKSDDKESSDSEGDDKIGKDADKKSDDGDSNKEADKLATLLEMVNEKVPKLTDLADKNPEAFKKVIGLVHKIVDMAKEKKKDLDKKEIQDMTEELNKAIKMFYPVGTVKQGKKKVMKDGKASWRSVKAGMVKDNQGNAISVESHNDKADDGTVGVRE